MKDDLGNRIKDQYENRTRIHLPRRTYTIIRIDGKAFHTVTKYCNKPLDSELMEDMDDTTKYLCENIQGAKFAYTQSDEISILLTDFETETTQSWFDGNIQKITSISASIATYQFNEICRGYVSSPAHFDSRVFTIPDPTEVENYFIWRQQDASRNSIQMLARSLYSHKECENKNTSELNEMCFQKGHNWNDLSAGKKRGRIIKKENYTITVDNVDTIRSRWIVDQDIPVFTQDRNYLKGMIPKYG